MLELNKIYNIDCVEGMKQLDDNMRATILTKKACTIFEYNIEKDIQGKVGNKDGLFFDIRKLEIIY